MKKPWEETWEIDPENMDMVRTPGSLGAEIDCTDMAGAGLDGEERAKLVAEAPAMWRLLSKFAIDEYCPACSGLSDERHLADCEWLRIAKAIGYIE